MATILGLSLALDVFGMRIPMTCKLSDTYGISMTMAYLLH